MDDADLLNTVDMDSGLDDFLDIDLDGVVDISTLPDFKYPAMLISGVKFNDSLRVLKAIRKESYRLFDVWVSVDDGNPPIKVGTLPASIETLVALKYLGLRLELYLSEGNIQIVDLTDPSVLESFI